MKRREYKNKIVLTFCIIISSLSVSSFVCKSDISVSPLHETRGVWVTRWDYTTATESTEPDSQKAQISELFALAKESNLNTVFFQVRGTFDAYYKSNLEPWAAQLTDTLGKDPGWDPLQYAINEARYHGLRIHAWVNTFTLWRGKYPPEQAEPAHMFHRHPEWIVAGSDGIPVKLGNSYTYASPGNPEVREHVLNVVLDIANNYDVDGIHFDYIRYPDESNLHNYSHDRVSDSLFISEEANPNSLGWEDWQRRNISLFVKSVKDSFELYAPNVILSAAVLGKYMATDWNGYDAVYQDGVRWANEGWFDFIVPMAYSRRSHNTSSFTQVLHDWNTRIDRPESILAGVAAYRTEGDKGWQWTEIGAQINDVRREGIGGMVFFNITALKDGWKTLHPKAFFTPSLPQPVERKGYAAMRQMVTLTAEMEGEKGVKISWSAPEESENVRGYALFRWKDAVTPLKRAENLAGIIPPVNYSFVDYPPGKSSDWSYVICSIDKLGRLSPPSESVSVRRLFASL